MPLAQLAHKAHMLQGKVVAEVRPHQLAQRLPVDRSRPPMHTRTHPPTQLCPPTSPGSAPACRAPPAGPHHSPPPPPGPTPRAGPAQTPPGRTQQAPRAAPPPGPAPGSPAPPLRAAGQPCHVVSIEKAWEGRSQAGPPAAASGPGKGQLCSSAVPAGSISTRTCWHTPLPCAHLPSCCPLGT